MPLIAVFAPSVPPEVKVISAGRAPRMSATTLRAASSPCAAASPTSWWLAGLPNVVVR